MSTVDERLMAAGSFTVDIDPEAPERIKALTDNAFMQVVVTSVWVDANALSVSDLLSIARYSGVYRRRSQDRCRWEGAGLAILLGDEDGKGNTYATESSPSKRPLYDGSNTSVIRNLVLRNGTGGANGITVGTIASSATPTKKLKIEAGDSPREVLDDACDAFTTSGSNPYEWSISPSGALSVALRNTLFPTSTAPTCLASRDTDVTGSESVDLLPVSRFDQVDDWEDFTTTVAVHYTPDDYAFGVAYALNDTVVATSGIYYECVSAHTSSGANFPPNATYWAVVDDYGEANAVSVPYDDPAGSDVVFRRYDESKSVRDADDADAAAARKLARFDDPDRRPTLSTDMYDVGLVCRPGDSIYVYDPDSNAVGLSTQVDTDGGLVFPLTVRVRALTWPIRSGMGVYAVVGGTSGTVTDVTDWVVFDESDARVEVGALRRSLVRWQRRWRAA